MRQEEQFILFSDIKELFFRSLKWIVLGVLVFGAIGFWVRCQVPIKYKIQATFKDSEKNSGGSNGVFETLLKVIDVSSGNREGHVLLTSTPVLTPVIEKLGLQASVQERSNLSQKWKNFKNSVLAEREIPIVEKETFMFSDVSFPGEFPKQYILFFRSKELFELRDIEDRVIAVGELGVPLVTEDLSFTLNTIPKSLRLRNRYPFSIQPIQEVAFQISKKLEVAPNKQNNGLLHLTLVHSNRTFGKQIVNALMDEYQKYLERDNKQQSKAQIAYLEGRRDEFCQKMEGYLQTHVDYMKENLKEKGSFTLGQHLPLFQERRLKFSGDLHALDLKRKRLLEADPWTIVPMGQEIAALQENLHLLSKEKDELNLALMASPFGRKDIAYHVEQLDTLQKDKITVSSGIDQFFSQLLSPNKERESLILQYDSMGKEFLPDSETLLTLQKGKKELEKLSLKSQGLSKEWLNQNLRLASLQEEVEKKRLLSGMVIPKEYQGIDLKTAKTLLLDSISKRDAADLKLIQMFSAEENLNEENVEYISLTAAFPDPISQELVREMGELKQKLHNERNYTEKESERFRNNLLLRNGDLKRHMKQAITLTQLERERLDDRIKKIQRTIVDLLGQEIALIEKQIQDRIEEQLNYLDKEEELIEGQLAEIKMELEEAPDLWLKERQLQFSADMNQGMLESLVRLVESKNIENDVSILRAKPVNYASASIFAKKPLLFLFGGIGGFLGGMIVFILAFMHAIYHGFPLSLKNLSFRGKTVLGKLKGKESKEVLRHISQLIHEKNSQMVTLVMGREKEFCSSLATLMAQEGKKILVIDLDTSIRIKQKNLPGLLHYLEGEVKEPSIHKKAYGDYIPLCGGEENALELLKHQRFRTLLENLKKSYDLIFFAISANAKEAIPKEFFSRSDLMIIRLEGDSFENLKPYFNWENKGNSLAFL